MPLACNSGCEQHDASTATKNCLPRGLHDVLELHQSRVRLLCIVSLHRTHQVGRNVLRRDGREGVVHIHGLRCRDGCDHVAQGSIDCLEVSGRCHALGIHTADGFVMRQDTCLQSCRIHCCTHNK